MTISQLHDLFLKSNGVTTDTRKISKDTLFFALKGDNFDGNTYAQQAIELGASYAIIDNPDYAISSSYILVSDVLTSLQKLATYHRQFLAIPIIALTGSNGKTTTKELINAVLSTTFTTTATLGNLNNHIGVPLTLLSMTKDTEIGIVEMGANHIGEIDALCTLVQPDYGYITNIGKAHLEGFGGIEGVLQGKTELYRHLQKHQKLVFLNADDPKLVNAAQSIDMDTYTFSQQQQSDQNILLLSANPMVAVTFNNQEIYSSLIGTYNFTNIAAAITIGTFFKVSSDAIKKAITSYIPTNNRSQIIEKEKFTIIMDAYNANPTSMIAALENFNQLNYPRKLIFLGDMFELGDSTASEHQKINELCTQTDAEAIHLIGAHFSQTSTTSPKVYTYPSFEVFQSQWKGITSNEQTAVLIKGSRGMQMERILELL